MRLPPESDVADGPNLTPVIDIVFNLLIFFLVATQFEQQERLISINLAEVLKARPIASGADEVVVNVTTEGKYVVLDQTLSELQLIDFLHAHYLKNPGRAEVQIRADRDVKFLHPLTVIGICENEDVAWTVTVLDRSEL